MQAFLTLVEYSLGFKLWEITNPEKSRLGPCIPASVFQEDGYRC